MHPASVNETEAEAVPVGDCDQSIACCPCAILNHGAALANETIEERTLPNVRAANQCNERQSLLRDLLHRDPCALRAPGHWVSEVLSDVVRYCGVAAAASASCAISAALTFMPSVPAS